MFATYPNQQQQQNTFSKQSNFPKFGFFSYLRPKLILNQVAPICRTVSTCYISLEEEKQIFLDSSLLRDCCLEVLEWTTSHIKSVEIGKKLFSGTTPSTKFPSFPTFLFSKMPLNSFPNYSLYKSSFISSEVGASPTLSTVSSTQVPSLSALNQVSNSYDSQIEVFRKFLIEHYSSAAGAIRSFVHSHKVLTRLCLGVFTLVMGAVYVIWAFQHHFLYRGSPKLEFARDAFNSRSEELYLTTPDNARIHCWFLPGASSYSQLPTILFLHSNEGNMSTQLRNVAKIQDSFPCNVFLIDYRGFGLSQGISSQKGLLIDAQCALDHLLSRSDIDKKKIFIFGRELGGSIASFISKNNPDQICGLIVENTFTSKRELLSHKKPWTKKFLWLLRDKWETQNIIKDVKVPILFFSGKADSNVPPKMMEQLFNSATNTKSRNLITIPKGDENDTCFQDDYMENFKKFVQEISTR